MKLHNHFSNLLQLKTDRLKSFFDEHPVILKKYVDGSIVAVTTLLKTMGSFVRHLLVVQGLDPDTSPYEKNAHFLRKELSEVFEKVHRYNFDEDYDFSWVKQKFAKIKENGKWGDLTEETFVQLTDLSKLTSPEKVNNVTQSPIDELIQRVNPVVSETPKPELSEFNPGNAIQELKDFMLKIEAMPSKEDKSVDLKTSKKKLNKGKRPGTGPMVRKISPIFVAKKEPSIKEELFAKRENDRGGRVGKLIRDMIDLNLIEHTTDAVQEHTKQMMAWSEEALAAMERVVAKHFKKDGRSNFTGSFRRIKK